MRSAPPRGLASNGSEFPFERLGQLRDSSDASGDSAILRERLAEEGYLFLPDFLDRDEVLKGRRTLLEALAAEGVILAAEGPDEARMAPGQTSYFRPELAQDPAIQGLLYSAEMMRFFDGIFQEEAMHYDFTWLRAASPGVATRPHYDIVYMGRGSQRVCTAWIPYSDIDYDMSGLAILEGSHKLEELKSTYGTIDVDRACANKGGQSEWEAKGLVSFGALPDSVGELAERFDLRWLTSEFRMGDLLIFSMYTLHCSTDNRSEFLRLSTDSRYQPASEPADERWIGPVPIGHGANARREMIC